jgi:hypothetical protein
MSESTEQQALFQWAAYNEAKYPELKLLFHIPNGGKRYKATAIRLKKEGVKAGVPDVFLPVARGGFHGLYVEMKAKKGKLSDNQLFWIFDLSRQGYKTEVCFGWEQAKEKIEGYLGIKGDWH